MTVNVFKKKYIFIMLQIVKNKLNKGVINK